MSEQMVKVEVGFGNYARAMDVFVRATLVSFGDRTMYAHIPESTVGKLKERNIPYRLVMDGTSDPVALPTVRPLAAE